MKKISNLIPFILVVYLVKSFILGSSYFDFGVIALMSASFLYKLKLDKDILTDKDELKTIISQLEEKVNKNLAETAEGIEIKYKELRNMQEHDRLAAETKFSTLNLGMQRQTKPEERRQYGWNG